MVSLGGTLTRLVLSALECRGVFFPPGDGEHYNVPFSLTEIREALSQCHNTSPGPNDVPYAYSDEAW